jgi:ABC-type bacteriocin/lantibiotic exporter with double-glycine peptidase domain
MSIGQLIGPIVSGLITDKVGFERACALLGLLLMGLAIIYFPMCFLSFPQPDLETIK